MPASYAAQLDALDAAVSEAECRCRGVDAHPPQRRGYMAAQCAKDLAALQAARDTIATIAHAVESGNLLLLGPPVLVNATYAVLHRLAGPVDDL